MSVNRAALEELVANLEAQALYRRFHKIEAFQPSPKQLEFIAATAGHTEVMLRAGNQQGKSEVGAYSAAAHLTGDYPKDWPGRKFPKPITCWAAGIKGTDLRDISQAKLCGDPPGIGEAMGTGFIPKEAFHSQPSVARGVTNLFDTVFVKHLKQGGGGTIDGISTLRFKTYPEEQRGFQGKPVDLIWLDEEPHDWAIYEECQARTIATRGLILVTLTPKRGRTTLVNYFEEARDHVALVKMGLRDATHLSPDQQETVLAKFVSAHDRDAILWGDPVMGEGRIFEFPEENLIWPGRLDQIPPEWAKLWGIDFGINHPFGAALLGHDRDLDVVYLLHCFKIANATPLQHIPMIRAIGANVPVSWPHDGHQRDKGSGEQLAAQYRIPGPGQAGLSMLGTHATWPDGSISTETGVMNLIGRMETGRFKVRAGLMPFWDEYRNYHRENGLIVKVNDDIISATMKALMMLRFARSVALGTKSAPKRPVHREAPLLDPWTGQPLHSQGRVW